MRCMRRSLSMGGRSLLLVVLILAGLAASAACQVGASPKAGPVVVVGSWTGSERIALESVLAKFTEEHGQPVEYIETRDLDGVIDQRLDDGLALDLAGIDGPRHLAHLVGQGALVPLAGAIDLGAYKSDVAPTFVELGSVDERPYGVFIKSSVKGLIWYATDSITRTLPVTWDEMERHIPAADGGAERLWCVGLESGASSGWPGTDWIETILIRHSGPDVYDNWVAGRQPWNSPELTRAFQMYGQVVADDAVHDGSIGAISTDFTQAGEALFTDPPGCVFYQQGSFVVPFLAGESRRPGADFDFFPFPQITEAYDGAVVGGGDLMGLFSDNPAAADLISYLVSEEGQQAWVDTVGGALSINARVDDYPNSVARRAAQLLVSARQFRFDASDQMPTQMRDAFLRGVLDFTEDQRDLPQILTRLDQVRARAY